VCLAVLYRYQGDEIKTFFTNARARLPVMRKNGDVVLIPWGRHSYQAGNLPLGGWALHERILASKWDAYFPKPVKIPLLAFMEKDFEGQGHWQKLLDDQWIQGLLAHHDKEYRLYIVTITPELEDSLYQRWPLIKPTH